jgi:hypothetical protein
MCDALVARRPEDLEKIPGKVVILGGAQPGPQYPHLGVPESMDQPQIYRTHVSISQFY